jgi:hypothetical protein
MAAKDDWLGFVVNKHLCAEFFNYGDGNGMGLSVYHYVYSPLLVTDSFLLSTLPPTATDNASAATAGVPVGGFYRTNADPSVVCVRTA